MKQRITYKIEAYITNVHVGYRYYICIYKDRLNGSRMGQIQYLDQLQNRLKISIILEHIMCTEILFHSRTNEHVDHYHTTSAIIHHNYMYLPQYKWMHCTSHEQEHIQFQEHILSTHSYIVNTYFNCSVISQDLVVFAVEQTSYANL